MKRALVVCLIVCSVSFALSIKVGIYDNPPQVFLKDGQPAGLYIEVLQKIAEENGWKLEYVFATFPEHLENLKDGRIDVLVSIAYTQEREKIYDYNTEALLLNWGVLCVHKSFDYRDITDLAGQTIAISKGDVYGQAFMKEIQRYSVSVNWLEVPDYPDVLRAVQERRAMAGVVSRIYAAQNHQKFDAKITGTIFSPVELRFAFPKGAKLNSVLIEKIDEYLRKLKSNYQNYNELLVKYLGVEKRVVPAWLATLFLIVGVGLVLFAAWSLSLRALVKQRTRQLERANEELKEHNEEIIAQQQELSALNEQLENAYAQLESSMKRFSDMLNFLSSVSPETPHEDFYSSFLFAAHRFEPVATTVLIDDDECYVLEDGTIKRTKLNCSLQLNDEELVELAKKTLSLPNTKAVCYRSKDTGISLLFFYNDSSSKMVEEDLIKALYSVLNMYVKLKRHEETLSSLSEGVARAFLQALEFHEQYTAKHSETVRDYAVKMARKLGLTERETQLIACAALVHDLGKLAVPSSILNKPAKLSAEELVLVRQHPVVAANILQRIKGLEEVAKIVRYHHERWDGKGYPDGLSGEEIPIGSRIISIADAFEAMTSDRPYRKALGIEKAVSELLDNAAEQFDPDLVEIFLEILVEEGVIVLER